MRAFASQSSPNQEVALIAGVRLQVNRNNTKERALIREVL
jgi:hypothetical protein